ncbi:hypothetical protein BHM03_00030040, partial [Ensete ventricosum]
FKFNTHISDNESIKIKRFGRILKLGIRSQISILKLQTYIDVLDKIMIIERDIEEIQKIRCKDKFINKNKRENESESDNKRVKISRFGKRMSQ